MLEAVDGGKLVGGRVAFEGSVLLGGDGGEALAEALGVFGLGDGFAAIEVGAAGVGPGVGAEVEAAAGTQGKAGLGLDFGAVAAIGLAGVVGLLRYETFHELFSRNDLAKFGGENVDWLEKQISEFYSDEQQKQTGVVGIEFELV